jgi:hypothetical protein
MDLEKLTNGDKVVLGAGLLFLISVFLPWFGEGPYDGNGFDVGFLWGTLPFLLVLVMVGQIAVERFTTTDLPEMPVTWGQIHLGIGGLIVFLVGVKFLLGYEVCFLDECVSISRKFGLFVAFLAAIGLAAGGFLKMQEDAGTAPGGSPGSGGAPPQPF